MDETKPGILDKILDRFSKKELLSYFIIIDLAVVIIILISWKLADSTKLVDLISFAGNIASILLALIAIIYAFFQTFATQDVLNKITEKVDEVTIIRDKVSEISAQMAEVAATVSDVMDDSTNLIELTKTQHDINPDVSNAIRTLSERVDILQDKTATATASTASTLGILPGFENTFNTQRLYDYLARKAANPQNSTNAYFRRLAEEGKRKKK